MDSPGLVRGTWPSDLLFVFRDLIRRSTHIGHLTLETMTSINKMSETEALDYISAELQILNSILGELVPEFWKTLIDQWEQEWRRGVSPVDRQYPLDELPKMATEWLLTRNTLQ